MKKKFVVVKEGILDGHIEYAPESDKYLTFRTFTAAKRYLETLWRTDIDFLRSNLAEMKQLRRVDVVRGKRRPKTSK